MASPIYPSNKTIAHMTLLADISAARNRTVRNTRLVVDPLVVMMVGLVLCGIVYPICAVMSEVAPTDLARAFSEQGYEPMVNSVVLTMLTVAFSTVVALPLAWLCARTDLPGKGLLTTAISLSYVLPVLLTSIAYIFMFGRNSGLINTLLAPLIGGVFFNIYSFSGVVLVSVLHSFPLIFLTTLSGLSRINPELEEAGLICGMSPIKVAIKITLGAVLPSVMAGVAFVTADTLTMLAAPLLLGAPVGHRFVTTDLYSSIVLNPNITLAIAMSLPLILLTVFMLWVQQRAVGLDGSTRFAVVSGKASASGLIPLGRMRLPALALAWLPVLFSLLLPCAILVCVSLMDRWWNGLSWQNISIKQYVYLLNDATTLRAMWNSATTALGVGFIMSLLGGGLAIALASTRGAFGKVVQFLAELPLGIPHVVAGVVIIIAWYGSPFYLGGSIWLLVLGYVFVSLPYALKTCRAAYGQIDPALGEAAQITGATRWQTQRLILAPLMKNGLVTTFVLTSLFTLKEFSLTVMIYSPNSVTLPVRIYQFIDGGNYEMTAATAIVLLLVTLLLLLFASRVLHISLVGMKV